MDQSGIHIGDVRQLVHKVIDDWRLDQRKGVRDRIRDFEDRFEKLEAREFADDGERRSRLQQQLDDYMTRVDGKYAMIDEAHRQMSDFVDSRAAK